MSVAEKPNTPQFMFRYCPADAGRGEHWRVEDIKSGHVVCECPSELDAKLVRAALNVFMRLP